MSISLAPRMQRISASATATAMARAAAAKAEGRPVISLTTGEPDFDTPAHIQEAAIAAMRGGATRYTAVDGTQALKTAIAEKLARENNLTYAPEEIIASTGAKQVIFNALLATISSGDEVIIPSPSWVSYPDITRLAGGTPVDLPTSAETGFKPTPEEIRKRLTARTRAILLNSPSNPTGATLSEAELKAIGAVLEDRSDILVISDEIYEHIRYTSKAYSAFAEANPGLKEQTLTVNGVSKSFAMTGWRLGYGAGPAPLIKAMRILQSQSTTNPNSIAQAAATAALTGEQDTVRAQARTFEKRRDSLLAMLKEAPGLSLHLPEGAFYLFIGIADALEGRIGTEEAFVAALLDEENLGVVGGDGFGASPYIRLSFAASEPELDEAATRLIRFCKSL